MKREPAYRPATCHICHKPMPIATTGRPRKTCSDRCRQIKRRRYDYTGWRIPRREDQAWRQAERDLRKLEKVVGRLPDTVGPILTLYDPHISVRQRILIRMSRGMDVPKCLVCWKPFITEDGVNGHYCSQNCADTAHQRAKILLSAIDEWSGRYDPRVDVRVRLDLPIRVCPHCNKPFPEYDRRKIYCSARCRKAHWRAIRRVCLSCGELYLPKTVKQKYCNKRCRRHFTHVKHYQPRPYVITYREQRDCAYCGTTFPVDPRVKNHRYCKRWCWEMANQKPLDPRICMECGEEFTPTRRSRTQQIFCSPDCEADRYERLKDERILKIVSRGRYRDNRKLRTSVAAGEMEGA